MLFRLNGAQLRPFNDKTTTMYTDSETALMRPNPTHGTIPLLLPAECAPAELSPFDALGRCARCYAVPTGTTETVLDLRGLPAGLYVPRRAAGCRLRVKGFLLQQGEKLL